jgi:hypothetical protein
MVIIQTCQVTCALRRFIFETVKDNSSSHSLDQSKNRFLQSARFATRRLRLELNHFLTTQATESWLYSDGVQAAISQTRRHIDQMTEVQDFVADVWKSIEHESADRLNNRNMNASLRLATLASLFLPLSLATGILAMQTRFRDLGPLLFDYFGLSILLITFAAVVFGLTQAIGATISPIHRVWNSFKNVCRGGYRWSQRRSDRVILWTIRVFCPITTYVIVVAATIYGMFESILTGITIIGYTLAAETAVVIVLLFCRWARWARYYSWLGFKNTCKRIARDPENPTGRLAAALRRADKYLTGAYECFDFDCFLNLQKTPPIIGMRKFRMRLGALRAFFGLGQRPAETVVPVATSVYSMSRATTSERESSVRRSRGSISSRHGPVSDAAGSGSPSSEIS